MTKQKRSQLPAYPHVVESFSDPQWSVHTAQMRSPACHNGQVYVEKYRITIERIEEPIDVLRERLLNLWREKEYNTHDTHPMKQKALELGIELDPNERATGHRARKVR